MGYEKAPAATKAKSNQSMAQVTIRKTGDEGVDQDLVGMYEGLGYTVAATSKGGAMVMEAPMDRAKANEAEGVARHKQRERVTPRADMGGAAELISDVTTRMRPMSPEQMIGTLKLPDTAAQDQSSSASKSDVDDIGPDDI